MTSTNAPESTADSGERVLRIPGPLMSDPEYRVIRSLILRLATWRLADQAHPRVRRWAVPALCAVLGLPAVLHASDGREALTALALAVAYAVPLLWRDRRPLLVFAVVSCVLAASFPLDTISGSATAWVLALHQVGRHETPRRLALAASAALVEILVWAFFARSGQQLEQMTRPDVVTLMVILLLWGSAALGLAGRLVDAAMASLEKERDQQARLATAQERARVSREMHDILGHTLAVIVGLADGAAALAVTRPESGADTLRIIADSGRDALGELRRLLAVIGDEDAPRDQAPLAPQPGLADLDALLQRIRAAGPTATLRTEGDLTGLTRGLQLAVYRIVQEALTNSLKYAGPDTTVTVTVTADAHLVRVAVEDTGPAHATKAARPSGAGSGRGVVGMRQRAALYEGSIAGGPNLRGGWTVRALLKAGPSTPSATGTTNHPAQEPPA
ncbi:histidine kinase [Streptomyces sp. ME02-8801-2C]|uniref:sensor histidine kinase n=1 Tax=Streptomyces sp. ME02-8801-2C TaxID=3028680 RepID=UPI0029A46AF8|nr:histidine kinase [Streptomyces sp. ME02-8801-2C]MDX3456789.1 histidine kinase [Streptomyces sp. ME02-8801-2C]